MFCGDGFRQKDEETFLLEIPENRDYKILQLTDLHLGFGLFSHKKDNMAKLVREKPLGTKLTYIGIVMISKTAKLRIR